MTWLSFAAVFLILGGVVLLAMLPFSLRTQDDEGDVTLGTTSSAPRGPHMARAVLRTTLVALLIFGALLVLTRVLGYSFEDIPRIAPKFR
jgi:predicted secreted protein